MIRKLKWYSKQAWRVIHGDLKDNDEFILATYPVHDGQNVHNYPIVNNEEEALAALEALSDTENEHKPS
jgi:hypothetical protein